MEFDNQGSEAPRALYVSERRTIYINLDHAQVATARAGRDVEDPVFRRLAYEIAFVEYAIAVASELNSKGLLADTTDAIFEITQRINAVALRSAPLYA